MCSEAWSAEVGKTTTHVSDGDTDVETLFAVLSGPSWAAQVAERMQDDCTLVSREESADGSVILVMSRRSEPLPGFISKLAPSDVRIITTDSWGPSIGGVRSCTWTAEIPGTPVRIRGTQTIEPVGDGTRHTASAEVTVQVPLVGGKIESFICEQIQRIAHAEEEVVRAVLA
ncbi:MAG: hypothetical protein JWO22_374 [Frankiales bacterium]|nr:hypothetical protein [Frankiales bacterium]